MVGVEGGGGGARLLMGRGRRIWLRREREGMRKNVEKKIQSHYISMESQLL